MTFSFDRVAGPVRPRAMRRSPFRHICVHRQLGTLESVRYETTDMPLPPLRHPAWLMVATIACLGAALTSWMGGSTMLPIAFVLLAAVFAMLLAVRLKRTRRR